MKQRFQPAFSTPAVFADVEHKPFPNLKPGRCALSGQPIAKGEPAWLVKFSRYNDAPRHYVSDAAGRADPAFLQSVDDHAQCRYPARLMYYGDLNDIEGSRRTFLVDEAWARERYEQWQHRSFLQTALHSQEAMMRVTAQFGFTREALPAEIAKPFVMSRGPLPAEAMWERLWEQIVALDRSTVTGRRDEQNTWELLGTVVMCELHVPLLARLEALSPEMRAILACSDHPAFERAAIDGGLLPGWDTIRATLAKPRLDLDDMLALAAWGTAHPDALALLYRAHGKFGVLSFSQGGPIGFGMLDNGHGGYLNFLYAGRPDLSPMLTRFAPEAPRLDEADYERDPSLYFLGGWNYNLPYLYRATVVTRLLAGDAQGARQVVALMRQHVDYYYHGSPDGFVNMTATFAERYIKRHLKG